MRIRIFCIFLIGLLTVANFAGASDPLRRFKPLEPEKAPLDVVFNDLDGGEMTLGDYKGKIIILNFWATWCMPCIAEMPSLNKLSKLYKHDNVVVVAIAKDKRGPITPEEFLKRTKFYQMVFAMDAKEGGLFEQLKVEGLPTTFIINEDGMIVGKLVGGTDWAHEDVLHLIQKYIEGEGPKPLKPSLAERVSEWFEGIRSYFNDLFTSKKKKEEPEEESSDKEGSTPPSEEGEENKDDKTSEESPPGNETSEKTEATSNNKEAS